MNAIKTKFWLDFGVRSMSADGIVVALCLITFPPLGEEKVVDVTALAVVLGWPIDRTNAALGELHDVDFLAPDDFGLEWVILPDLVKFAVPPSAARGQ